MSVKKHSVRKGNTAFQTWKVVFLSVWIFLMQTKSHATALVTHVSVTQEKWSIAKRQPALTVIKICWISTTQGHLWMKLAVTFQRIVHKILQYSKIQYCVTVMAPSYSPTPHTAWMTLSFPYLQRNVLHSQTSPPPHVCAMTPLSVRRASCAMT